MPPYASERDAAFNELHPGIQRWIWQQGWPALRPVQCEAIPILLARTSDAVIAAPTAGGKTEAAFLPILTDIAAQPDRDRLRVICVSPLRALINDQTRRLEAMSETVDARVQPWHGDTSRGRAAFWKRPAEILITTPESLEALLMRRARDLEGLLPSLRYLLVDELHSFIGSERGAQLQSLLRRVELLAGGEIPRVALSATLGDPEYSREFLRPSGTRPVVFIQPERASGELKALVKVVIEPERPDAVRELAAPESASLDDANQIPLPPTATSLTPKSLPSTTDLEAGADTVLSGGIAAVAEHLFKRLRGETHLVFANSRARVELLASELAGLCEAQVLPNEFFAHHGSLSKELRLDVEARLREGVLPTTAIATSTLEMGIDLGDIVSIGQIGPAPSVSALKQRVGRSGRRPGSAQILRQYILLRPLTARSHPLDALRLPLIQAIAQLELMSEGRYEPPLRGDLHLSSLVQQILSIIYQHGGGATAKTLWHALGGAGPFAHVDIPTFTCVLRALGQAGMLEQAGGGSFVPGANGEKQAEHYTFYASFQTPEEYQLIANGRPIGALPIDSPVAPGQFLLFGSRRWQVLEVRETERIIMLAPARGGVPPDFGGNAPIGHALVHQRMREILSSTQDFAYLDPVARECLGLARFAFTARHLDSTSHMVLGREIYLAHWGGSRVGRTLALWLQHAGLSVEDDGPFLCVTASNTHDLWQVIGRAAGADPISTDELMPLVPVVAEEKFEPWLISDRPLLERAWSARWLNVAAAHQHLQQLVADAPALSDVESF